MHKKIFFIILLIIATSVCDTISQILLKLTINSLKDTSWKNIKKAVVFILNLAKSWQAWLSLGFAILSLCIWLFVLAKADLNYAFSVDSIHYIFIVIASKLILKEKINSLRLSGTFFIMIGVILVTLG